MKLNITSDTEHYIQYKTMALMSWFLYGVAFVFFLHQSFKKKYLLWFYVNPSLEGGGSVKWSPLLSQALALSIMIFVTPNLNVNFLDELFLIFK